MSTSSMAGETQEAERPRGDTVRVKDETLKETKAVCSVPAQTREEVCSRQVAVQVKVESLLEVTASYSVAARQTEESSREVCKDPSRIETAACVLTPTQEKRAVLVRVKVEPLLEDSLTQAQEEACSMKVAVKEEPLWTETEATCSIQDTRTNCSREEVRLKKELVLEASVTMISQEEEEMQKTATCSTTAHTQKEEDFSEVLCVKEECSLSSTADFCGVSEAARLAGLCGVSEAATLARLCSVSKAATLAGLCGVSEAATLAGLYTDHTVKEDVVVGPDCLQPPDAVFTRVELELSASRMRACCVKLERCDRLLTPRTLSEPLPSTQTIIYECDTCAKTYPYKSDLIRHIQTHLTSKIPKSTRRTATDTIQQKGHTLKKENKFPCQKCGKQFAHKHNLQKHNLIHAGLKPHICQICNKGFRRLDNLKSHIRTHTGEKPYSCDICHMKFSVSGNLKRHQRIHMNQPNEHVSRQKKKIYQCDTCAEIFKNKCNLVHHIQTHSKSKIQHRKEEAFSCQTCSKNFTRKDHLKKHNLIHAGLKPQICQICSKGFRHLHDLKRHERTHTGEKPYSCDVCNKNFTQSGNLTVHQRIHMNLKPYICEICNNRFTESSTLKKHKNTHFPINIRLRQNRFCCTICRKSFTHSSSLKVHQRIHSGEKPYTCDICTERFSRRDTLVYHVLAHAGKGPLANRKAKKSTDRFS